MMKRALKSGGLAAMVLFSTSSIASLAGPPVALAANERIVGHSDFGPWKATAIQGSSSPNSFTRQASRCDVRANGIQLSITGTTTSVISFNYSRSTDDDNSDDEIALGIIDLAGININGILYKTRFVSSEHPSTQDAVVFGHGALEIEMHDQWLAISKVDSMILSAKSIGLLYNSPSKGRMRGIFVPLQSHYIPSAIGWCKKRL